MTPLSLPSRAAASTALVIRPARADDAEALRRLAQLDSSRPPAGEVLVAEVRGELWAALSLEDRHAIADPFRPSGALVTLLSARARQLRHRTRRRTWLAPLRPALG